MKRCYAVETPLIDSMQSNTTRDALAIWHSAVDAVQGRRVVRTAITINPNDSTCIEIDGQVFELSAHANIIVVGAGKAALGMLHGVVDQLSTKALHPKIRGWINIPGETPVESPHPKVVVHPCRPLGSNFPTEKAILGTRKIRKLLADSKPEDLVLCLISGGGSSLLVDPIAGLELADKVKIARVLSDAGANIHELNCVRRMISNVKAGGLVRDCKAATIITLIISDVLNDDLATIASGPTYEMDRDNSKECLAILDRYVSTDYDLKQKVLNSIINRAAAENQTLGSSEQRPIFVLANNATAVDAAGVKAVQLGYRYYMVANRSSEGDASLVGVAMAKSIPNLIAQPNVDCHLIGGEPTVNLSIAKDQKIGRGGRNQHLVLSAAAELLSGNLDWMKERDFCLLSGGTDGEDGSTTAAGAWIDNAALLKLSDLQPAYTAAIKNFDSNTIFEQLGTLIDTGPTNTNVCDLRVLLIKHRNTN